MDNLSKKTLKCFLILKNLVAVKTNQDNLDERDY